MARTFVPEQDQRAADITALKNTRPTANRVVTVDSDADGERNQFLWDPSGEATNADGVELIESNITEFADGGANEGLWRRIRVPTSVSDSGTDTLTDPSDINFANNLTVTDDGDGTITIDASGASGIEVEDDGTSLLTGVGNLNFGTDLDAVDDGDGTVTINATGASSDTRTNVSDNGTQVVTNTDDINFASNLSVTDDGDNSVTVDASGSTSIDVDDSGADVATGVDNLNFGTDLSVTDDGGGTVTIDSTASGGASLAGSAGSIQINDGSGNHSAVVGGLNSTVFATDSSSNAVSGQIDGSLDRTLLTVNFSEDDFADDEVANVAYVAEITVSGETFTTFAESNVVLTDFVQDTLQDGTQVVRTPVDNDPSATQSFEIQNVNVGGLADSSDPVTLDISGQGSDFADMEVSGSNPGNKLYVVDRGNTEIDEYNLSTNFDVTSASFNQSFDVSGQDGTPEDVTFNTDGSKMFVVGNANDDVYEYSLTTNFDVSTASLANTFDVSGQTTNPVGISFNRTSNGTIVSNPGEVMYVIDGATVVYRYDLGTGFDTTTAGFNSSIDLSGTGSSISSATGVRYTDRGRTLYASSGSTIFEFRQANNSEYEVSGLSEQNTLDVSGQDTDVTGVTIDETETVSGGRSSRLYITGNSNDNIVQYDQRGDISVQHWSAMDTFGTFEVVDSVIDSQIFDLAANPTNPINTELRFGTNGDETSIGSTLSSQNGARSVAINGDPNQPTYAAGKASFAQGLSTSATGQTSAAFGNNSIATGPYSVAFGFDTQATQNGTFVFGNESVASQNSSLAGGTSSLADGSVSFAFGNQAEALESRSVSIGESTSSQSFAGTALGRSTIVKPSHATALGLYNEDFRGSANTSSDLGNINNDDRLFAVGAGENPSSTSGDSDFFDGRDRVDALYVTMRNGSFIRHGLQVDGWDGSSYVRRFDVDASGNMTLLNGTSVNEISTSVSGTSDDVLVTEAAVDAAVSNATITVEDNGTQVSDAVSIIDFNNGLSVSTGDPGEVVVDSDATTEDFGTGTFSGDGSTTTFSISHNLGVVPTAKFVQATTDDASGISHITADSSTITVNYDTAPPSGTDNVVIDYVAKE